MAGVDPLFQQGHAIDCLSLYIARIEGFEPPTSGFGDQRSTS